MLPASCQLIHQRLGVLQVGGVEALGKPAVDRREQVMSLGALATFALSSRAVARPNESSNHLAELVRRGKTGAIGCRRRTVGEDDQPEIHGHRLRGGAPSASRLSSRPSRRRQDTRAGYTEWPDIVSLEKVVRFMASTSSPSRASVSARTDPAQRAPMITTSPF